MRFSFKLVVAAIVFNINFISIGISVTSIQSQIVSHSIGNASANLPSEICFAFAYIGIIAFD